MKKKSSRDTGAPCTVRYEVVVFCILFYSTLEYPTCRQQQPPADHSAKISTERRRRKKKNSSFTSNNAKNGLFEESQLASSASLAPSWFRQRQSPKKSKELEAQEKQKQKQNGNPPCTLSIQVRT